MPLPWKKSKSSRISRFVTDLQQSPKHGGSLVVETGFPTSLIDLFVKNRDRLKKSSSKRIHKSQTPQIQSSPSRRRIESSPPIPPLSLARYRSLPLNLDTALVLDDSNKIEESLITPENINDENNGGGESGNNGNHGGGRGGGCVLMVAVFKVFMVAVLALSAKKLAVGITISAFALLFLELAVTRVFTYFNLCPNAHVRIDSLIEKLIGNRNTEKKEEEKEEELMNERRNKVSFEIMEEPKEEEIRIISQLEKILSLEKTKSLDMEENKEVEIIRYEKSKSQRLKSKIVKKIVPKKLRSYKKKRKMKKMKQKEEEEGEEIEVEIEEEEEEEESMTEVSSLFSEERNESEISERDDIIGSTNLPLLETCGEIEEEEEDKIGSKGDVMKVISLIVIVLVGLLCGKVFAIGLTLSWCLILRSFCCKSQTQISV